MHFFCQSVQCLPRFAARLWPAVDRRCSFITYLPSFTSDVAVDTDSVISESIVLCIVVHFRHPCTGCRPSSCYIHVVSNVQQSWGEGRGGEGRGGEGRGPSEFANQTANIT